MTDPYGADAPTGAAPLNPPVPAPTPGLRAPSERPPVGDFFTEDPDARRQRAESSPPLTADEVEGWAAQLLGFANWMRRNHLP